PTRAIALQIGVALAIGLGLGFWIGPVKTLVMLGLVYSLGLVLIYGVGNLGVVRYFIRVERRAFNPIVHLVFPIASTAALAWAAWKSVHPLPAKPTEYAPLIVGLWLAAGVACLGLQSRRGRFR